MSPLQPPFNRWRTTTRVIDCLVGALLIISALFKAASPTESATLIAAYGLPAWASVLLIQLEVILGVLLITGIAGSIGRFVALFAFLFFASFSAYRALAGYESCGCFGSMKVHPWITFGMDLFLIALLAWSVRRSPVAPPRTRHSIAFAIASCLLFGGTAWGLSHAFQSYTLAGDDDVTISAGSLVLLEPETWSGKPLPIAEYISPRADLSQGDWTLLLYHHDCPDCRAALPRYEGVAAQLRSEGDARRLLLIEIPPYGADSQHDSAISATLSDKVDWFVQAPVEIQISNGIVKQASRDLPSIAALRDQFDDNDSTTLVQTAKVIVE